LLLKLGAKLRELIITIKVKRWWNCTIL